MNVTFPESSVTKIQGGVPGMNGLVNAACPGGNNAGTRSRANNLWEAVTHTAGKPRQMSKSSHIPGDIYRWGSQF